MPKNTFPSREAICQELTIEKHVSQCSIPTMLCTFRISQCNSNVRHLFERLLVQVGLSASAGGQTTARLLTCSSSNIMSFLFLNLRGNQDITCLEGLNLPSQTSDLHTNRVEKRDDLHSTRILPRFV